MRIAEALGFRTVKRASSRWALLLALPVIGPVWADAPDCGSVLTDTSRSLEARRALVRQCLASACRQEAAELALQPDAMARFMGMCTVDQFDLVSAEAPSTGRLPARGGAADACVETGACADFNASLEATAAGMGSGGRPEAGHTFVRVQRITEVIER